MGEVYKARDTRLNRVVAIKVLPTALASDAAFRERFDREARALSQLDDPHICALYDVGQEQGTAFLVMQYLEGETLADRLAGTSGAPLPLEEALAIGVQIADALATAHRAGIVHRDLKPGNVMLVGLSGRKGGSTAAPVAKLLDFGLAKSGSVLTSGTDGGPGVGVSALPTTPANLTVQGTILGTFQYMAPEQLEGQEADARTDIFAFGALLYEMLTGRKAFSGKSHASLVGAIMTAQPPPVASLVPLTPPTLDHVVSRCLAKDPDERWQSASDLMRELRWVTDSARLVPGTAPTGQGSEWPAGGVASRRTRAALVLLGAAAGAIIVAVAALGWNAARAAVVPPREITRFAVQMSPNGSTVPSASSVWVSRDGRSVVFAASDDDGQARLHVRRLGTLTATPLRGTELGGHVSFSPDGQWIAFVANQRLMKVPLSGGAPVPVATVGPDAAGTSWSDDGTIVIGGAEGLRRVLATGGTPELITKVDPKTEIGHRFPLVLPGGRAVAYTRTMGTQFETSVVVLRDLSSGTEHEMGRGSYPRLGPDNTLVFAGAGFSLWAIRFDPSSLAPLGEAVPVLDGVNTNLGGQALFDIAEAGTLVYRVRLSGTQEIVWLNPDGSTSPVISDRLTGVYHPPLAVSPDETRVAITAHPDGGSDQVVLIDLARGVLTPLIGGARMDSRYPSWTPDGSTVAFSTSKDGSWDIFTLPANGSTTPTMLVADTSDEMAPVWSSTDHTFVFQRGVGGGSAGNTDIWTSRDGKHQPLVTTQFLEWAPALSPNGGWLAYASNELGSLDVYAQPYPGPGPRTRVSNGGGEAPRWSRDGKTLYYRQGADALVAVDITVDPALRVGRPRVVVRAPFDSERPFPNYDVLSDGRIIALIDRDPVGSTFVLVENWDLELAAKLK